MSCGEPQPRGRMVSVQFDYSLTTVKIQCFYNAVRWLLIYRPGKEETGKNASMLEENGNNLVTGKFTSIWRSENSRENLFASNHDVGYHTNKNTNNYLYIVARAVAAGAGAKAKGRLYVQEWI